MKRSYKTTMSVFALATVALMGSQMVVSAHQGGNTQQKGATYNQERRATMTKVFADNDYEAWKTQMQDRGRWSNETLTKENFQKMNRIHQKMMGGDYEGARALRAELGIGGSQGNGQGKGIGMHRNNTNRGQNMGGNFVDENGDGVCDHMN